MQKLNTKDKIKAFLEREGYEVTEKDDGVMLITDEDGFTIFAMISDIQIEMMVDICGEDDLHPDKLLEAYRMLLDKNTEILPTCYGIYRSEDGAVRIVLVDSLVLESLDENELKFSLSSIAQNTFSAVELLTPYYRKSI